MGFEGIGEGKKTKMVVISCFEPLVKGNYLSLALEKIIRDFTNKKKKCSWSYE